MGKRIGFIGAGKAGFSLGKHIREEAAGDYTVHGFYSKNPESAREAAAFTGGKAFLSVDELAAECDVLLLTVPDGQIAETWKYVQNRILNSPAAGIARKEPLLIGHCSGSLNSAILKSTSDQISDLFAFGSLHPIMALRDKETAYQQLPGAYFTIEGDRPFTDFAEKLLLELKNPYCIIDADSKTLYHAALVLVSNLVCALTFEGMEVLKACGLDEEFAENAWRSLFLSNAENIASVGPVLALTGPIERADTSTVSRHLKELSGDAREIYLSLSRILINTAQKKNPDRDYSELKELLCNK